MKKSLYLMAAIMTAGVSLSSCSSEIEEIQTPSALNAPSGDERFVSDNITASQAAALLTQFLNRTNFFYFEDVIGIDPNDYLLHGAITVNYQGTLLKFRSIHVSASGKNGKYGVYASSSTELRDVYSLNNENTDPYGEVIYENNEETGMSMPVAVRYSYSTNATDYNSNCWIVVEWESNSDFRRIIGL